MKAGRTRLAAAFRVRLLVIGAILLSVAPLHAERYALLVGIGKYQHGIHGLDGPAFDVEAVRAMLLRSGYRPATITVLLDDQATHAHIVEALRAVVGRLKSGDHLLFYFSGHGTSAFDRNLQFLSPAIGPDSGGLATYDLALTNLSAAVDSLIIGRRDLRPYLTQVPSGAQALVVLDACYSENSAKNISIYRSAPVRGLDLEEIVQDHGTASGPAGSSPPAAPNEPYPYSNVVALAAASKDQPAIDINAETMASKPDWRTVDGKPHGALTNTLLDALSGNADTNHDGVISYDEMFRYIRRQMEKYPHQPQLLSAAGFPLDQPALGGASSPLASPAATASTAASPSAPARLRVSFERPDPAIEGLLRQNGEIALSAEAFDLLLRKEGSDWAFYDPAGILIQKLPDATPQDVASRVQAQARLAQLSRWSNPRQNFNLRIDAEPEKGDAYEKARTVFRIGERVRFRISTERPAFLLLLDIDKDGRVTVLFPGPPLKEHGLQPANQSIEFLTNATLPPGSEQLKLIGFPQQPPQWNDWTCSADACPSFNPTDPQMGRLMQLLKVTTGAAETSLRVITRQ